MKRVIFLGGTVRSGTTLIGLILANSDNAISLGEVMHLFEPYKQIHYDKINELKQYKKWNKIISDKKENLYNNIFKYFPEIDVIIDSSKDPFWFEKLSKNNSVKMIQLVTYKDPRDLKNSFSKRGLANWEKVFLNYYKRFFTIFPMTQTVSLDRILDDKLYLKELCSYVGLNYFDDKIEYWHREQPNFFGSKTIKQNKINSNILSEKKTESIKDSKVKSLFENLKSKQFIYEPVDINYYYPKLILMGLFIKDKLMKKIKYGS